MISHNEALDARVQRSKSNANIGLLEMGTVFTSLENELGRDLDGGRQEKTRLRPAQVPSLRCGQRHSSSYLRATSL